MLVTLKLLALAALFVGTGGTLFPDRFRNHKPILIITALIGVLGTAYLFRDLYDDLLSDARTASGEARIDISAVPRLDAHSLGLDYSSLYIDSDETYSMFKDFIQLNTNKVVFLDIWLQEEYLDEVITLNRYGRDASEQIRYGFCPDSGSQFSICDSYVITNQEIFRGFLDTNINGSIRITGYFFVETAKAPRMDINIPSDKPISKRFLRAVNPF